MATREALFWGRIVEGLWRPDRVLNRIENGVLDGMPDSYLTIEGVSGWIELKCPLMPKRETTALFSGNHQLSITQRNWLLSHRQAGGIGFVGIEVDRHVLLIGARHADTVNTSTLAQLLDIADFWAPRPLKAEHWAAFTATFCSQDRTP